MRTLKRNETAFFYSGYVGKVEILKDGKHTGKFQPSYSALVPYKGNISAPSGQAQQEFFGIDTRYTHVLVMDNPNANIREGGLVYWNWDVYEVKAVRPSLNVLSIALMKRLPMADDPIGGMSANG